jgi:hypothetical protein
MFDFTQILEKEKEISSFNMDVLRQYLTVEDYPWFFSQPNWGLREHYRLLAYISSKLSYNTIFDIGTFRGHSSLALSQNKNVKVVSYDIVDIKHLKIYPNNVEYNIGDFRKDPRLHHAPFIMIDVAPHDGIQEQEFHKFFIETGYKGVTFWDDIHFSKEMTDWWTSVNDPSIIRMDISSIGHYSGTGMIIYR